MDGRSPRNLDDAATHGYSRSDAPAQPPTTFGTSLSTQSPRTASWGNYSDWIDSSLFLNGQLIRSFTIGDVGIPDQTTPTTEPFFPHSTYSPSSDINNSTTDFAIRLLKPRPTPTQGSTVILPRIETQVYLDIDLPSGSWDAILLQFTKSVIIDDSSSIGRYIKPLLLAIIVRGATTRQEFNHVCKQCEKRMGNKSDPLSMIDFHGPSNIITPRGGTIQVHFTFSCYSRHHRKEDKEYMYVAVAY